MSLNIKTLFIFLLAAATASAIPIRVIYSDAANTGFRDPTPRTPLPTNPGTTLGAQRKIAFEFALSRWTSQIAGTIPLKVRAGWSTTTPNSNGGITLASASPVNYFKNGTEASGLPRNNTFYASALADQVMGRNLISGGSSDDISVDCNSYLDEVTTDGFVWDYSLDNSSTSDISFVGVTLHEIGHGLGFISFLDNTDGTYSMTSPSAWDALMTNSSGTPLRNLSPANRLPLLTGNEIYSDGTTIRLYNNGNAARVNAPTTFVSGSSLHHFDEVVYSTAGNINELMTPNVSFPTQMFGPLVTSALRDMGYTMEDTLPPTADILSPVPGRLYTSAALAAAGIFGTTTDTSASGSSNSVGLLRVRLALSSQAQGKWYRWETTPGFDSPTFQFATHTKSATIEKLLPVTTGSHKWTSSLPDGLPDGNYEIHIESVDQNDQGSGFITSLFTIDNSAPSLTIEPWITNSTIFNLDPLAFLAPDAVTVGFDLRRIEGGTTFYWTGTNWSSTQFPLTTTLRGGRWYSDVDLPGRASWPEGQSITIRATATDAASNVTIAESVVNRTPLDTTSPTVAISSPPDGAVYAERALAVPFGTALDAESDISSVGIYLMRFVPGGGFKYWSGNEWSDSAVFLPSNYQPEDKRWWTPALGYRLPSDTELPDATYKVQAVAYNREVSQQGSILVEHTFRIAVNPPQVRITSPAHSGFVKEGWTISGTASDPSGTGFDQNGVSFTLVGSDGRYWDGSAWNVNQRILEAVIQPDGTWTYPVAGSGDTLPMGETEYSISASVKDNNGNVSVPIAGGQSGNNQVIFKVDTTPPTCVIVSPVNDTVITQPPLLASIFNGTASDSSGQPQVTLYLKRLSDEYYWTGSNWTSTVTQAALPGIFEDGAESDEWVNATSFPCLNQYLSGMPNGVYEMIAIAKDAAGNQTQRSASLVINYNPVWLAPQDQLARVLPKQTAPIDGATVTSNLSHTFTTWLTGQEGNGSYPTAGSFTADSQGRYFVTNRLSQTVFLGGGRTYSKSHGVIQRVGAGGWRRQRTAFSVSNGDGSFSSFERWSPDGPAIPISPGENVFESEPGPAKTDAAGNTYATFNLIGNSSSIRNLAHALVVKFDADGNVVWRRSVPEFTNIEPPDGWLARVVVQAIDLMPDGSLSLILENATNAEASTYILDTVVVRMSPGGVALDVERLADTSYQQSAVDGSGNAFVMTGKFLGVGSSQQVIRKMNGAGEVLARLDTSFCHEPQVWEKLATDASGNLYVLGVFDMGNGDGRTCVTKYDSSLNKVWRRFGPERSVYIDPFNFGNSGGDYRLHVGNIGITVVHSAPAATTQSEYPDEHPLILRFSPAGDLHWTRAVAKTDEFARGIDVLSEFEITTVGDVLFRGFFNGGQGQSGQSIYGKISNAGDLQFYSQITGPGGPNLMSLLPDGRLAVLHSTGFSLSPVGEQYIKVYENPASVLIPVTLDTALPGSRTVAAGDSVEFKVVNRGSAATYQWRKEDGLGVPQNISGATKDTLLLSNIQTSDAGRYSCVVTNAVAPAMTSRTAVLTVLQPVALDVALDTPGRTWTTGGDAPWSGFLPPSPNRDFVDAAASGTIGDDQSSWVETTVTGPVEVSFWWKVQSESGADPLTFTVNGTQLGDSISSDRDWAKVTHTLGAGQHVLRWTYQRDGSAGFGANKAWLDTFSTAVPPITVPLAEALDTTLTFTTGGSAVWRGIGPTPTHDGVDAAVSGDIGNSSESWMETTVSGPGTLSYWWKVSSEAGFDYLEFYLDGALQTGRISGNVDWQKKTFTIPSGSHTLRWRYVKDSIIDAGLDLGWVDEVVWATEAMTLASWRERRFTPAQLADPLISGLLANPNNDDVNNLLAFALDLDPVGPGVSQSNAISHGKSGNNPTDHFIYNIRLPNPLPSGITYIVEVPRDATMSVWDPIATRTSLTSWDGAANVTQDPPSNGYQMVHVHDPVNIGDSDFRIMRLKVIIP